MPDLGNDFAGSLQDFSRYPQGLIFVAPGQDRTWMQNGTQVTRVDATWTARAMTQRSH